jgi:hypothetical protein
MILVPLSDLKIPGMSVRLAVQEFQIGGTSGIEPHGAFTTLHTMA